MRHDFAGAAVALLATLVVSSSSAAQTSDNPSPEDQAARRITEAMDQHYLATRFDEALATLGEAIEDCEQKCSAPTVARLWMYVGLVNGSGRADQAAARQAFDRALALDRDVSLDERFSTEETERSFRDAGGKAPIEAAPTPMDATKLCTPHELDVLTRSPVPVSCRAGRQVGSMTLRYLPFRGDEWITLEMKRVGEEFRATIPCSATEHAGTLSYYVLVSDEAGDLLDAIGSKTKPLTLQVDAKTKAPAPSFPGEPAPARCAAEEICPPDFPGCVGDDGARRGGRDWQESCNSNTECRAGLLCRSGRCEVAPSCDIDSDCETGLCKDGRCDLPVGGQLEKPAPKNHRLALSFAVDVGFVGGRDVCTAADSDYECFERGSHEAYPAELDDAIRLSPGEPGDPYPGARMNPGATIGTRRLLLEYAWIVSPNLSLAGRVGWAFGGGPATPGSPGFLPLHAEGAVSYWPLGVRSLVQPRITLAVGLAQVDLAGKVTVRDCSASQTRAAFEACIRGDQNVDPEELPEVKLEAYRKLGRGFVGLGGGVVVALLGSSFAEAGLRAMLLLPEAGFVLEPSVGAGYTF